MAGGLFFEGADGGAGAADAIGDTDAFVGIAGEVGFGADSGDEVRFGGIGGGGAAPWTGLAGDADLDGGPRRTGS